MKPHPQPKPWSVAIGVVGVLCITACAVPTSPPGPSAEIISNDDPFRPYREYSTPEIRSATSVGHGAKRLLGRIDRKSGQVTTLLQFEIAYTGTHRRLYETARNDRAEPLTLTTIQRNSKCQPGGACTYSELFLVVLPETELRQATSTYQVKLLARNGPDALIDIPGPMLQNLFARIAGDRAQPSVATPTGAPQSPAKPAAQPG